MKDSFGDVTRSWYRPKQSGLTHIPYVMFGYLMTKNADVLPPLKFLFVRRVYGKELGVEYLDSEQLHATFASFVV